MSNIRVYPECKEPVADIVAKATEVGLDQIDYSKGYSLRKRSSKRDAGYPEGFLALRDGYYYVVGGKQGDELYVWIYGVRYNGEWFKTSPVINVIKKDNGFILETWNSFYDMDEL